jgi:hypothetical protein
MNIANPLSLLGSIKITSSCLRILFFLALAAGIVFSVQAQGELPTGTVSSSGSGPYDFILSFSDGATATAPIGSVWYAWVPGFFYLPSAPTTVSAPAGWSATIANNGANSSIQFVASSAADYITPGHSLSGFGFTATFSPAQLAAAPNSGVSFVYAAGLFSDAGQQFTVQAVPEPSTLALLMLGATGSWLIGRRKLRAS